MALWKQRNDKERIPKLKLHDIANRILLQCTGVKSVKTGWSYLFYIYFYYFYVLIKIISLLSYLYLMVYMIWDIGGITMGQLWDNYGTT